jgi:hypothetical protein
MGGSDDGNALSACELVEPNAAGDTIQQQKLPLNPEISIVLASKRHDLFLDKNASASFCLAFEFPFPCVHDNSNVPQ